MPPPNLWLPIGKSPKYPVPIPIPHDPVANKAHMVQPRDIAQTFTGKHQRLTRIGGALVITNLPSPSKPEDEEEDSSNTTVPHVPFPMPPLDWVDTEEVWQTMMNKDIKFQRNGDLFANHPMIEPHMRAALIDWLSQVAEQNSLTRETFELTIDYVDRYLSSTYNVRQCHLALIGVACMVIAGKMDNWDQIKMTGLTSIIGCSKTYVVTQERSVFRALKWNLNPITMNAWIATYLNIAAFGKRRDPDSRFEFPDYSVHAFTQITRLCDLCHMDAGSLRFRYSILAASALFHHTSRRFVEYATGYKRADLDECINWMLPFSQAILENREVHVQYLDNVHHTNSHNIHQRTVSLNTLDRAYVFQSNPEEGEKLVESFQDSSSEYSMEGDSTSIEDYMSSTDLDSLSDDPSPSNEGDLGPDQGFEPETSVQEAEAVMESSHSDEATVADEG